MNSCKISVAEQQAVLHMEQNRADVLSTVQVRTFTFHQSPSQICMQIRYEMTVLWRVKSSTFNKTVCLVMWQNFNCRFQPIELQMVCLSPALKGHFMSGR
jgi:hypothetical protein